MKKLLFSGLIYLVMTGPVVAMENDKKFQAALEDVETLATLEIFEALKEIEAEWSPSIANNIRYEFNKSVKDENYTITEVNSVQLAKKKLVNSAQKKVAPHVREIMLKAAAKQKKESEAIDALEILGQLKK
ncbi:hypothetical protein HYX58_00800 [Candidatus Dependentiae bacterium]|nr:hypothetical protein [Candidatus Dependentiae bacterium]